MNRLEREPDLTLRVSFRRDRERVLHGSETGVIDRSIEGGYSEDHAPVSTAEAFALTQHQQYDVVEPREGLDADGVATGEGVSPLRARLSRIRRRA